jgi:hypothetical protein
MWRVLLLVFAGVACVSTTRDERKWSGLLLRPPHADWSGLARATRLHVYER